jgi:hypothetical protein
MKIKITRSTKMLEDLEKKLRSLTKASVASGYFPESGLHPESGLTYAELMNQHEYGFGVPKRPVRQITLMKVQDPAYWAQDIKNYLEGKSSLSNSLHKMGMEITTTAQSIFGSTTYLQNNSPITIAIKGKDSPLKDSGDLREAWTWKISLTPSDT